MSGGGGKGGSQTTSVELPGWVEDAARSNLSRADEISQIGYVPYRGPDVAAFSPQQIAGMQGANQAASAFGMAAPELGIPEAQQFAGGISGYSSAPLYDQALAELQATSPGQYEAITGMFIDPITGTARQQSSDAALGTQGASGVGFNRGGVVSPAGNLVGRPEQGGGSMGGK